MDDLLTGHIMAEALSLRLTLNKIATHTHTVTYRFCPEEMKVTPKGGFVLVFFIIVQFYGLSP